MITDFSLRLHITRLVPTKSIRPVRIEFILGVLSSRLCCPKFFQLASLTETKFPEYMLSVIEPSGSTLALRLKRMFAIDEISRLPLHDQLSANNQVSDDEHSLLLERCTQELSELIECLFWTLPTIEMVFKTMLARQTQSPALDEREMLLLKPESDISLSNMKSEPVKELLEVDLELIAAMRESLKDTKYGKYMEQESAFDPKQLYKELGEESAQVKYWAGKLAEEEHSITEQTQAAITLNLARIAHIFSVYTSCSLLQKPC